MLRAFYKLFYLQFCNSSDQWKKYCVAKVLLAIWETFLHENNHDYDSYRFSYRFAFILFLSFFTNQKQESGFQQVYGLVMFLYSLGKLYFVSFLKEIFLNMQKFEDSIFCSLFCNTRLGKPIESRHTYNISHILKTFLKACVVQVTSKVLGTWLHVSYTEACFYPFSLYKKVPSPKKIN